MDEVIVDVDAAAFCGGTGEGVQRHGPRSDATRKMLRYFGPAGGWRFREGVVSAKRSARARAPPCIASTPMDISAAAVRGRRKSAEVTVTIIAWSAREFHHSVAVAVVV